MTYERPAASGSTSATAVEAIDPETADGAARPRARRIALRRARPRHRLRAVRAADPRRTTSRAASSTGPSRTSRRSAAAADPARRPAPSSAVACSASRRPTRCAQLGLETHVVEFAPRLMPVQVDDGGRARPCAGTSSTSACTSTPGARDRRGPLDGDGRVPRCGLRDGRADSTPRSSCSRPGSGPATSSPGTAGLDVGERGGVVVDDALPHVRPAHLRDRRVRRAGGRIYGLVAPGYEMAEVVADAAARR